jgi:hypothetical protein
LTVKQPPKRNWKVVWYVNVEKEIGPQAHILEEKRCVRGLCDAKSGWLLFFNLRGKPHLARPPELWRGQKRVL